MKKFKTGTIITTQGVMTGMNENSRFYNFCISSLERHKNGDWGNLPEEDIEANTDALEGNDRLFSSYNIPSDTIHNSHHKIYIITEYDRSVTTILYPSEY